MTRHPAAAAAYPLLTITPDYPFAHGMATRVFPGLVDGILSSGYVEQVRHDALRALASGLRSDGVVPASTGVLTGPADLWSSTAGFQGRAWVGLPSYAAEATFYTLLLEATGYGEVTSQMLGWDPFGSKKAGDLRGAVDDLRKHGSPTDVDEFIVASLWGNLGDQAHREFQGGGSTTDGRNARVLVDDTGAACDALAGADSLGIVLDNAGAELVADLMLSLRLLRDNPKLQITLYAKQRPFFVSDATIGDLQETTALLDAELDGTPFGDALASGALTVRADLFFTSPCHYGTLPSRLLTAFAGHDVVVFKGDLNYRRLLGDRVTPADVPLTNLIPAITGQAVLIRTMKSDICAGLPSGVEEDLAAKDAGWRFSGRYGVIHLVKATP